MNKKISELELLEQLSGSEKIPVVADGENYTITPDQITKDFAKSSELETKADKSDLVGLASESFVTSQGYLKEVPSEYATTADVESKIANVKSEIIGGAGNDYDTLKEIETWVTSHQDLYNGLISTVGTKASTEDVNKQLNSKQDKLPEGEVGSVLIATTSGPQWSNAFDIDQVSYGVSWNDDTQSNPHLTRIGNPVFHKTLPIQSRYRGCVRDASGNIKYLNPSNWSTYEDGTQANLDGSEGDVYVETPRFYGKCYKDESTGEAWARISLVQVDDTWTEIPSMLISAYRSYESNGKARSIVNVIPTTYKTIDECRALARAADSELFYYDYYKWIFYWNYVIEYANFNSQDTYNAELTSEGYHQGGLGAGVTDWNSTDWNAANGGYYPITTTGYCNEFGNGTGVKQLDFTGRVDSSKKHTFQVPRWRGFDNPFGDVWIWLDGAIVNNNLVYTTKDKSLIYDKLAGNETNCTTKWNHIGTRHSDLTLDSSNYTYGYFKSFTELNTDGDVLCQNNTHTSPTGSATTFKCDYTYSFPSGFRVVFVGSYAHHGAYAGLGCFYSFVSVSHRYAAIGFRHAIVKNN